MKPILSMSLAVVGAAVVAYAACMTYFKQVVVPDVLQQAMTEMVEIDAYNEVGRLAHWDEVDSFLKRGCVTEAQMLVNIQQGLALSSLRLQSEKSARTRQMLVDRSLAIGLRVSSGETSKHDGAFLPKCIK